MNPLLRLYGKLCSALIRKYHKYRAARIREITNISPSAMIDWDLSADKHVFIGDGTSIGQGAILRGEVTIGRYCTIGMNFHAYGVSHDVEHPTRTETSEIKKVKGKTTIGDYCWIGDGVFVDVGVKIGHNCIIGAGSVVVDDIPLGSVAGGVPARVIRER